MNFLTSFRESCGNPSSARTISGLPAISTPFSKVTSPTVLEITLLGAINLGVVRKTGPRIHL
jgi:hypothetical protein